MPVSVFVLGSSATEQASLSLAVDCCGTVYFGSYLDAFTFEMIEKSVMSSHELN